MEFLLNLTWIVVVTLLCSGVCFYRSRGSEHNYAWVTVAVALICIATLIFPTISLSDDLHAECNAVESPAKQIHQLIVNMQQTTVVLASCSSILLTFIFAAPQKSTSRETIEVGVAAPLEGFLPPSIGRAPPIALPL